MPRASISTDLSTGCNEGGHPHPPRGYTSYRRTITIQGHHAEAVGDTFDVHHCTCHGNACSGAKVAEGAATVTFERRLAARIGDPLTDAGCTIAGPGARTFIIHGPPAAKPQA